MTVDPTDPDALYEDITDTNEAAEIDVEANEADAAEQLTDLAPDRDDSLKDSDPTSADEGDLAEQARVVTLDEDDYR
ncbi:hypothetical protein ACFVT5_31510 [Streptomyces sp. NPDC058001]|uniref:hypothetical protein n=1 Tax=Streptomyces sp. NPDC058001 TaxID=3346300 RepID=UPI0036E4E104